MLVNLVLQPKHNETQRTSERSRTNKLVTKNPYDNDVKKQPQNYFITQGKFREQNLKKSVRF